jgi:drug/metabolite transporter (DMT)-like permease
MGPNRILGVILLVVGVILLYFGINATDTIGEEIKEGLTGRYTDKTTWYIVGGAAAAVVGALMTFFSGRRTSIA